MKTKLLLLIFLALFFPTKNANCQNNEAIADTASWIVHHGVFDGITYHDYWYLHTTGINQLINGKNYISLLTIPMQQTGPWTFVQTGGAYSNYAFRNDTNKRAYIYSISDSTEYLWYDFNLSLGDTLPYTDWFSTQFQIQMPPDTLVVTNIDSVNFNGIYYKRFAFNNHQTQFPDLVEKIGFMNDLISWNYSIYFEAWSELLFFCPEFNVMVCPMNIIRENEDKKDNIIIYPNPTTGQINIDISNLGFSPEKVSVKEMTGKLIRTVYTNKNENNISIDLKLPNGIYLIEIQGMRGSVVRQKVVINN